MTTGKINQHKQLAMGKKPAVKMKSGGVAKGKEVAVKHVAMKSGGAVKALPPKGNEKKGALPKSAPKGAKYMKKGGMC